MLFTHARAIPILTSTVAGALRSHPGKLVGFSLRNTSAAAVQVDFYDAASATGAPLLTLDLPAKGSAGASQTDHVHPVYFDKGLYYNPSAATAIEGSVYVV